MYITSENSLEDKQRVALAVANEMAHYVIGLQILSSIINHFFKFFSKVDRQLCDTLMVGRRVAHRFHAYIPLLQSS